MSKICNYLMVKSYNTKKKLDEKANNLKNRIKRTKYIHPKKKKKLDWYDNYSKWVNKICRRNIHNNKNKKIEFILINSSQYKLLENNYILMVINLLENDSNRHSNHLKYLKELHKVNINMITQIDMFLLCIEILKK